MKDKVTLYVGVPLSTQDRVPSGVSVLLASCDRKEGSTSVASDTIGRSGHKVLEGRHGIPFGGGEEKCLLSSPINAQGQKRCARKHYSDRIEPPSL